MSSLQKRDALIARRAGFVERWFELFSSGPAAARQAVDERDALLRQTDDALAQLAVILEKMS